jgi:hypothetical protein
MFPDISKEGIAFRTRRSASDIAGRDSFGRARVYSESYAQMLVMAGLDPAIHGLLSRKERTWMPGTRPGMTAGYARDEA